MSRANELWADIQSKGVVCVRGLVAAAASEELYFDYKRSADDGAGTSLHQNDRATLAKAISGFGNSAGGVVIWGIDCPSRGDRQDIPSDRPIVNVTRFRAQIEAAAANATAPAHRGVVSIALPSDSSRPDGPGFVATFIPASDDSPHQVPGTGVYYIRAGSAFSPTPHSVLAGMFGRRPQPWVIPKYLMTTQLGTGRHHPIEVHLGLWLENKGRGIARDVFANLSISLPGEKCQLGIDQSIHMSGWDVNVVMGRWINILSKTSLRLPPRAMQVPAIIMINLVPPFDNPLKLSGLIGCDGAAPFEGEFKTDQNAVAEFYRYHNGLGEGSDRSGGPSLFNFTGSGIKSEQVSPDALGRARVK